MATSHLSEVPVSELLDLMRSKVSQVAGNNQVYRDHYHRAIDDYDSGKNPYELPLFPGLQRYPVDVEEFMFSLEFLGRPKDEIYPAVVDELFNINNPNGYRLTNPYTEAVFTGSIGSAKTTTALYTIAYQLYVLSCFASPHRTFGMDSTSEILMVFQSISGGLAQSVDYSRFREICEQSSYFRIVYPFDKNIKSILRFPNRVEVKAIGTDTGTIGQNVIGGLIDELNFMAVIQGSKRSIDRGTYNQALTIYNGISRRRKSRFLDSGHMPGILCLVSSKKYPGEFTDKKIEEAKTDSTIYIYDKRVWDVKPPGTFGAHGWFSVFIGDLTRKASIVDGMSTINPEDAHLYVEIPEDFRSDFEDDIIGALRDIAGVGTVARYPFLLNVGAVNDCFGKTPNLFSLDETDFVLSQPELRVQLVQDPQLPRWAHIDLGVTNDSCGLAIGHVPGFKTLTRMVEGVVEEEQLPIIRFDGVLRILPPKNDEIQFFRVRQILYQLRAAGVNIRWVSFDSFQSVDSIQLLKQQGFLAGKQSVDVDAKPYDLTKAAFYDGRLELPDHVFCKTEFLALEKDARTGRVDHTPTGSKDVADAVAGVTGGLSLRREIWGMFGVPIQKFIMNHMTKAESQHGNHGQEIPLPQEK